MLRMVAVCVPVVSEYRLRNGKVVESRMHPFDSGELVKFLADQGAIAEQAPG
jgi:hypothetical protein